MKVLFAAVFEESCEYEGRIIAVSLRPRPRPLREEKLSSVFIYSFLTRNLWYFYACVGRPPLFRPCVASSLPGCLVDICRSLAFP